MTRNRIVFSQPYLEYLLPLLSTLIFVPVLFNSEIIHVGNTLQLFGDKFNGSDFNVDLVVYSICSAATLFLSWTLNNLINRHDLLYKSNYLPSLLAVVYTAGLVYSHGLTLGLISVPLVLLSLTSLLNSLGEVGRLNSIFNSGFFLGLAILTDAYVILTVPIWIGIIVFFRPVEFRGIAVFLLGVFNVHFLLALLHLIFRDIFPKAADWLAYFPSSLIQEISSAGRVLLAALVLVSLLGIFCLPAYLRGMNNRAKDKGRILLISFFIFQLVVNVFQYSYTQDWSFVYFLPNLVYLSVLAHLSFTNRYLLGLLNSSHLIVIGVIFYQIFLI